MAVSVGRVEAVGVEIALRYGLNPHQTPARAVAHGASPFQVLNGAPGYINLLDAISAWQLVRELRVALDQPAAASFKHVSPAGAAIGLPLSESLERAYQVEGKELSPVAAAYVRARGGDLVSSYGDFAAVSDRVDASLAMVLRREVSDGIVAPGFDLDALEILGTKKGGTYLIIQADPDFEPPLLEQRSLFGMTLEAPADRAPIVPALLDTVVTQRKEFPPEAVRDLMVATIALRYTQSNSVCVAADGQVIGLGAGQQSRIHCSRIACGKADRWMLQQHPRVLSLPFVAGMKRPERFTAREQFIAWAELSEPERAYLRAQFREAVEPLSDEERGDWIGGFTTSLSHDAFMPFRDNIDRAQASAVRYVLQPGGSIADAGVTAAADSYGMTMALSGLRLFRH
ncbi:MAG: phosphoribosylaminoimidazolecarboxamide formyltransferase [Chloroflexi bacterium]|nr:MAG: phosphoribosylaminoimidazolecarboxamide formyltransferase [Chloroflexota bacterium]